MYRTVTAPDLMAAPGTVTCTKLTGVGSLTAGVYKIAVVAGNRYGRTTAKAGNTTVTTETTNLGVRAAFAAVAGADYYDIYCSTDANPKYVGRITEAQRAAGGILSGAVPSTYGAGGAINSIDIYAIGTGTDAATTAAVNTAYVMPAESPVGSEFGEDVDFDIALTVTALDAAPSALVVLPFYRNHDGTDYAGSAVTVTFGGATGAVLPLQQRVSVANRGCPVSLLVVSMTGTGYSLAISAGAS